MSRFSQGGTEGDLNQVPKLDSGQVVPGLNDVTLTEPPSQVNIDAGSVPTESQVIPNGMTSVMRVGLKADEYSPYVLGRLLVSGDQTSKILSIIFDTSAQTQETPLNIPLIGQTIQDLVNTINKSAYLVAEVLNDTGLLPTTIIELVDSINISSQWGYLYATTEQAATDPLLASGIRFFLTSVEPGITQSNQSQSVGGFVSPTPVYSLDTLVQSVSFYDKIITVEGTDLSSFTYVSIGDEIIKIAEWQDSVGFVEERRALGTPIRYHPRGSVVRGVSNNVLFTPNFNEDRVQYRCVAVKNISSAIARDVRIHFKLASRNSLSTCNMALEIPRSEYMESIVTMGDDSSFTDISIAGDYADGHFVGCAVKFLDGDFTDQIRIVAAFTGATGKFVLESRLAGEIASGTSYAADTAPAQRLKSGTKSPSFVNESNPPYLISALQDATFLSNGIDINVNEERNHGSDLYPNDVVYVWIQRKLDSTNESFNNNRSVLTVSYKGA